jgi:hypothetical protein
VSETVEVELVQKVDAVPVIASESGRALIRSLTPATQAMAVAAGGFVAGAAVVGLASRRRGRSSKALARARKGGRGGGRGARKGGRAGELVRIVGTRSLLVDVHLLDGAGLGR